MCWSGPGGRENFYDSVSADSIVLQLMSQLATVVEGETDFSIIVTRKNLIDLHNIDFFKMAILDKM